MATAVPKKSADNVSEKESTQKGKKRFAGKKVKKRHRVVTEGIAHIQATFNNTVVAITDPQGQVLTASSAGGCGFSGHRKATPYAGQLAAEKAGSLARDNYAMKRIAVQVRGAGIPARDSAIRALRSVGLEIVSLEDCTQLPHNGCRPPKKRRV